MFIILTLCAGIILGFILGYWVSLGEIQDLEIQNAEQEGRLMALTLDDTIDDLEAGKGDWAWPGKGY